MGQTKLCIKDRFQKHLLDIKHCSNWAQAPPSARAKGPTNVGSHFNIPRHSPADVQINVLELIHAQPDTPKAQQLRDSREIFWMHKLKTLVPYGINAMDGSNQTRTRPNRPRVPVTSLSHKSLTRVVNKRYRSPVTSDSVYKSLTHVGDWCTL